MNNLYDKIYEAVDNGIQKALIINNGQDNDVSVNWNTKQINNDFDPMGELVHNFITCADFNKMISYYENIIKLYRNNGYKYHANDYKELKDVIVIVCYINNFADLNWIDVSEMTDLSGLFSSYFDNEKTMHNVCVNQLSKCNPDISEWDISNVTNMSYMFYKCMYFNQPLDNLNVSNVTDMSHMFEGCAKFNQPLTNWQISYETNTDDMFTGCIDMQPENMPEIMAEI